MPPLPLPVVQFARRALAPGGAASREALCTSMQRHSGLLHATIETLLGGSGARILQSRALYLTARDHPWVAGIGTTHSGALTGMEEALTQESSEAVLTAFAEVLGHVVVLLTSFVGASLTMKVVQDSWPQLDVDDSFRRWAE